MGEFVGWARYLYNVAALVAAANNYIPLFPYPVFPKLQADRINQSIIRGVDIDILWYYNYYYLIFKS